MSDDESEMADQAYRHVEQALGDLVCDSECEGDGGENVVYCFCSPTCCILNIETLPRFWTVCVDEKILAAILVNLERKARVNGEGSRHFTWSYQRDRILLFSYVETRDASGELEKIEISWVEKFPPLTAE